MSPVRQSDQKIIGLIMSASLSLVATVIRFAYFAFCNKFFFVFLCVLAISIFQYLSAFVCDSALMSAPASASTPATVARAPSVISAAKVQEVMINILQSWDWNFCCSIWMRTMLWLWLFIKPPEMASSQMCKRNESTSFFNFKCSFLECRLACKKT